MNDFVSATRAEPLGADTPGARFLAQRLEAITTALPESAQRRETTRIPHIRIEAFCDSPDIATVIESAAADRLMSRAHVWEAIKVFQLARVLNRTGEFG